MLLAATMFHQEENNDNKSLVSLLALQSPLSVFAPEDLICHFLYA